MARWQQYPRLFAFFILLFMLGILLANVPVTVSPVQEVQALTPANLPEVQMSDDPGTKSAFSFGTQAETAALIDVTSGRILWQYRGDLPKRMASLTKIMTAVVAIEHGKAEDMVTVSKRAFGVEGSSIFLETGEQWTLEQLLYGLMLRSGNDAAVAIAEHVGGSTESFVTLMNDKAELLGLRNTRFYNPHGLDAEGHLTSSNDLARLTAYAMQLPLFKTIVKTKHYDVVMPTKKTPVRWYNKNKMLNMYEGADGVKTGYTTKARRCLVSSATRNGQQLAVVTLNDGADWVDHQRLLDMGFKNFPLQTIALKGESLPPSADQTVVATIKSEWKLSTDILYPLRKEEMVSWSWRVDVYPETSIEYLAGKRAKVYLMLHGEAVHAGELIQ